MHLNISMIFATIVTAILCLLPSSLSNLITTQTRSITINTVEQEQFIYATVVPRVLRPLRSFSSVSDWKARLEESKTSLEHSNTTTTNYRINAFNRTFDLFLMEDEVFLAPSFVIQHFDHNQPWINQDIEHCFYKGYVNEDPLSTVSISLCHGLFGTFTYDDIEYFIEPKHHQNDTQWNFEHLFYTHKESFISKKESAQTGPSPGEEEDKQKLSPLNQRSLQERSQKHERSFETISSKRRAKRQLDFDPTAKHIEVLVAYDQSIKELHSNTDIKSYILTLFSYVSRLYSDASIGNNIKIWLVKLVDLGNDVSKHIASSNHAGEILNKFCKWQRDYNTPGTYDAAILLTRTLLCDKRTKNGTVNKCNTLGLTRLGRMCISTSNCAVVRDNGFATAFTIANQIGYLLGIPYDKSKSCSNYTKEQNIMVPVLTFDHNHYIWSNCSRHYLTQYLQSNRYPCLNNIPHDNTSPLLKDLNQEQSARQVPGLWNDLNTQCRRAFGDKFKYCTDLSFGRQCHRLYCHEESPYPSSCTTNYAHWADGTLCSEPGTKIKRCLRGQCRSIEDLEIINGNWGEWSPWSPCTHICGSGIQRSHRLCDNPKPENGGQYCSGQSTRMQLCENNPPCKDSVNTFRQRQCSTFNNRMIDPLLPVGIRFEPKYSVLPNERCKLICKVSDDRLERSFVLANRVEDGTPCGREEETRDICIEGVCMPVGCDYKFGSNATDDVCGVCNGQNKTCKLVQGQKMVSDFGVTNIIDIPINTTYVSVTQISSSSDRYYLSVKHVNGTYVLNGMHSLQLYNVKFRLGDATLSYTGSDSGNESVSITGRLKVPLEIQVISIYQANTPATLVAWKYYSPFDEDDLARQ